MADKLTHVDLEAQPLDKLASLLNASEFEKFDTALRHTAETLDGHSVWNINSTAEGGGVAEILAALLPYPIDAGWDVRWVVMFGDDDFFEVTKGLHNALHGAAPTDDMWDMAKSVYPAIADRNAEQLVKLTKPGDIAIVHDPQPAGLIPALVDAGVKVSWQCHIGTDTPNEFTRRAWKFLHDFIKPAHRHVFTRPSYLWDGLDPNRLRVIPPSIDAFSSKNEMLPDDEVDATLVAAGFIEGTSGHANIEHTMSRAGGELRVPADAPFVLQVSRWDRLKDPIGYLRMFTEYLTDIDGLHAVYAGPQMKRVDDDPEGAGVFSECVEYWETLDGNVQDRLHLLALPMDDVHENARMVNALQRRANVVVQKSLQEGFGLTVSEAMWKRRPVVASRVGGIQDQIEHDKSGLLVDDPSDDESFAQAVRTVIGDPACAERLGSQAKQRVHEHFLAPRQLTQYAALIDELVLTP